MDYRLDKYSLNGRQCWTYAPQASGEPLPLIILAAEAELDAALSQAFEQQILPPCVLAGFEIADWNRELTPWPAPALGKKDEPFAGNARDTLDWVQGTLLPHLATAYPVSAEQNKRYIAGYSLAGLFALWSLLECEAFGGCASCSGSLWYDGWLDYAQSRRLPHDSRVYLSLGEREERARNPRMAPVGDVTRAWAAHLASSENIQETILVWHEGGHFTNVSQRIAGAIAWLLNKADAPQA